MIDVAKQLACYNKEFGIKSMAQQQSIMDLIIANIMAILKRPFDQGERKFFKNITQEKRIVGEQSKRSLGVFGGGK